MQIAMKDKESIATSERVFLLHGGEKYTEDRQCHNFPTGSTHTSICKPTLNYPLPLNFVEEGVDRYECQ